jgi:propionate CoA-transferase
MSNRSSSKKHHALSFGDKFNLAQRLLNGVHARLSAKDEIHTQPPASVSAVQQQQQEEYQQKGNAATTRPPRKLFMTAAEAVQLVTDDACVFFTGFGVHESPLVVNCALHERFVRTRQPRNLTAVIPAAAGAGADPKSPLANLDHCLSSEDVLQQGQQDQLVKTFLLSHISSFPIFRANRKVRASEVETHFYPQGAVSLILRKMTTEGNNTYTLPANRSPAGTVFDPRCGRGTPLFEQRRDVQRVQVDPETGAFTYALPWIDVVIAGAAAADIDGNIYFKGASCIANR